MQGANLFHETNYFILFDQCPEHQRGPVPVKSTLITLYFCMEMDIDQRTSPDSCMHADTFIYSAFSSLREEKNHLDENVVLKPTLSECVRILSMHSTSRRGIQRWEHPNRIGYQTVSMKRRKRDRLWCTPQIVRTRFETSWMKNNVHMRSGTQNHFKSIYSMWSPSLQTCTSQKYTPLWLCVSGGWNDGRELLLSNK